MNEAMVVEKEPPKPRFRETAAWWPLLVWLGPVGGLALFSFIPLTTMGLTWIGATGSDSHWIGYVHWISLLLVMISLPVQGTLVGLCWGLGGGAFWHGTFGVLVVAMAAFQCLLLGYLASVFVNRAFPPEGQFFFLDLTHWLSFDMLWHLCLLCGGALPLLLMGFQFPFLLMRILYRWRLVRNEEGSGEPRPADEALSIRDLLLGTALVAVSVAAAQYEGRVLEAEGRQTPQSYVFGILIAVAISTAVTTATVLPLTAVFLRKFDLQSAWARGGLIATIVTAVYVVPTIALWSTPSWTRLLIVVAVILIYYAGVAVGLTLLRVYGWRLDGREKVAG